MGKIVVFNSVSLDGYFTDVNSDMGFARNSNPDAEWDTFVAGNAQGGGLLVFGRITYELMAAFWPTPMAAESMPVVAERMNGLSKIVFSRTLETAAWKNTRLVKNDLTGEMQKMKNDSPDNMVIMGSGTLITQLTPQGLIDEYQIVVIPVVLGRGRTMFDGMKEKASLRLTKSRTFKNGNVFLSYQPLR